MTELFTTRIGRLRLIGFIEGVSFLVILFVTMPLKYIFSVPAPNKAAGLIYGLLFVLYVLQVIQAKIEYKWKPGTAFLALLAAIIPLGTFWADVKLFRKSEALQFQN